MISLAHHQPLSRDRGVHCRVPPTAPDSRGTAAADAPPDGSPAGTTPAVAPGGPADGPIPTPPAGRTFSPQEAECRARIEALLARPVAFLASQL